ncbi:MAG: energy-coupling factor transporter transmembrane protein EcfT [Clostridia bacterium]|nr:energy-coupling factor transporter transmembrane protein EcfT [Clostridia bacterium]
MDTFSSCHPLINFVFYLFAIGIPVFYLHPVFLAIGLAAAIVYYVYLKGGASFGKVALFILPAVILASVLNPLIVHQGETMLWYLPNGNPVTLEAVIYGIGAGFMLASVISWFASFQEVMTSDKFMYLFSKSFPAAALLLSMTMRFVPRFGSQIKRIRQAQLCVGRDVTNGTIRQKLAHGMTIFSIAVTWALENSVETADSMKSRGYGLRGRTNYSIYRLDSRDRLILAVMAAEIVAIILMIRSRWVYILYYPLFTINALDWRAVTCFAVYALFCLTPVIMGVNEDLHWKRIKNDTVI